MAWEMQLDESILEDLYVWIDSLSLSRPKKRIERDFSDGQLIAEIVHHYLPEFVDLHNYSSANSLQHKKSNWNVLNKKVLSNIGLDIPDVIINGLSNGKPGLIEVLLYNLRLKIDEQLELKEKLLDRSENSMKRTTALSVSTEKSSKSSKNNVLNSSARNFDPTKPISIMDYEQVKQQYFEQEEQLEILQAKLRRLEHVLSLKDQRIEQLLQVLNHEKNV